MIEDYSYDVNDNTDEKPLLTVKQLPEISSVDWSEKPCYVTDGSNY